VQDLRNDQPQNEKKVRNCSIRRELKRRMKSQAIRLRLRADGRNKKAGSSVE
jgi:hypothetical protein